MIPARLKPQFIAPMKALLQSELPAGREWLLEIKLDGIRAIGLKDGKRARLLSRRPRELTADHPEITAALAALKAGTAVVDGEIVALDREGRSSFQLLQNAKREGDRSRIRYILFDLLQQDGCDLTHLPLDERRRALQRLVGRRKGLLRFSTALEASLALAWEEVTRLGLEGLVAKRRSSPYEPGRRSGAWIKVKAVRQQEFVIGGYTPPRGGRRYFGAVLVGFFRDEEFVFASKVGTGLDDASLESLHRLFQRHRSTSCPFANLTPRTGRFPAGELRRWVRLKPRLVCEVKFQEWTRDGNLRQPVFLGLREDKGAREVRHEEPAS